MLIPSSTVGRKILMALTGQIMVLFVIVHVVGNSTIYLHWMNAYAAGLHALPPLLWAFRLFMITVLVTHVYFGIVLTLENRAAKPQAYRVTHHVGSTFAGRNMIWTGAFIFTFLVYHLLHFTFQITNPAIAAARHFDALGRPDVYEMVLRSFRHIGISFAYVVSMAALLLHLTHGIQSSFQTWGLNNDRSLPAIVKAGTVTATILFLGYTAIPVTIVLGILRP